MTSVLSQLSLLILKLYTGQGTYSKAPQVRQAKSLIRNSLEYVFLEYVERSVLKSIALIKGCLSSHHFGST